MPDDPTRTASPRVPDLDSPTRTAEGLAGDSTAALDSGGFAARFAALGGLDATNDVPANLFAGPLPAVPGYELLGELGRGGMGVVFHAREIALNRLVALKMVLAGPLAHPSTRARFYLEAESVAAVQHPGVVQVFAFGEAAGHPFLALEYLPGGTLADRIKQSGPLESREAAGLALKLAEAVAAAHAAGVVHRDLKPANVLLTAAGEPKVTDFGLAKVGRSDMTATGAVLGTPSYMAPEQAAGKTREVGTAADVYGLGAILYDLLTGRPPFKGDSQAATLQLVLTSQPARPRSLNGAVPRDLETICLKCLEKEPAKRYPTAQALADDLRRFAAGEPVVARPVGKVSQAWRWCRRNKAVASLLATVLVVFATGAGVAGYFAVEEGKRANEAGENARRAIDSEKEANDERDKVLAEQNRTGHLLYISQMNHVSVAFGDGRIPRLVEVLEETRPRLAEADRRGWEWHYFDRLTRPAGRSFTLEREEEIPDGEREWILSADGRRLMHNPWVMRDDGPLQVWDTSSGKRVATPIPSHLSRSSTRKKGTEVYNSPTVLSTDGTHIGLISYERVPNEMEEPSTQFVHDCERHQLRIWEVSTEKELPGTTIQMSVPFVDWYGRPEYPTSLVIGPGAAWATWIEPESLPPVRVFGVPVYAEWNRYGQRDLGGRIHAPTLKRATWDRASGLVRYARFQPGAGNPAKVGMGGDHTKAAPMTLATISPSGQAVFTTYTNNSFGTYRRLARGGSESGLHTGGAGRTEGWDLAADPPRLLWATGSDARHAVVSPSGNWAAAQMITPSPGSTEFVEVFERNPNPRTERWGSWSINLATDRGSGDLRLAAITDGGQVVMTRPNTLLVFNPQRGTGVPPPERSVFYHRDGTYSAIQCGPGEAELSAVGSDPPLCRVWDISRTPGHTPPPAGSGLPPGRLEVRNQDGTVTAEWGSPPRDSKPITSSYPIVLKDSATGAKRAQIDPPSGGYFQGVQFVAGGRRVLSLLLVQKPATPEVGKSPPSGSTSLAIGGVGSRANVTAEWLLHDLNGRRVAGGPEPTVSYRQKATWGLDSSIAPSPKGRWLANRQPNGVFVVLDALIGETAFRITLPKERHLLKYEFDTNEDRVLVATAPSDARGGAASEVVSYEAMLYEVSTGRAVWGTPVTLSGGTGPPQILFRSLHFQVFFTLDGRVLIGYPSTGKDVVWIGRVADGSTERTLAGPPKPRGKEKGSTLLPRTAFWLDQGQRRIAVAGGHVVEVWDIDTGQSVARLGGHDAQVSSMAFTPDGSRLFTLDPGTTGPTGKAHRRLHVWDLLTGRSLVTLPLVSRLGDGSSGDMSLLLQDDKLRLTTPAGVWEFDGTAVNAAPVPRP